MNVFLILLVVAAAIGALVSLVRGVIALLKTTEADLNSREAGPSVSSVKQNKMMLTRITFQAVAVLLAAILLLSRGH